MRDNITRVAEALPERTVTVPAGTRATIRVNDHAGTGYQPSARLKAGLGPGIAAERPMYFDCRGWTGGRGVVGYAPWQKAPSL